MREEFGFVASSGKNVVLESDMENPATAEQIAEAKRLVEATRQRLGEFEWGPEPKPDGVKRSKKETT